MIPAPIGIVAGSGIDLLPLLDSVEQEIPFRAVPGLPEGKVPGHECVFLRGRMGAREIILQCGRLHLYEGFSVSDAVRTVDALHGLGARSLILTNAVGGLLPGMRPGAIAAVSEVIPWRFRAHPFPKRMTPDWTIDGADHCGPLAWMHGPCYETRAEIAALQCIGAATVGMSAAPELFRAKALCMPAAILSVITNSCIAPAPLTHAEVINTARAASARLAALIAAALR